MVKRVTLPNSALWSSLCVLSLGCPSSSSEPPPQDVPTVTPATSSSSAPRSSARPPTVGAFVTREEAREAGLPDVGVRIENVPREFTALKAPNTGTHLSLGGPPTSENGTLMLVVRGYRDREPDAVSETYRAYLKTAGGISRPMIEGPTERVNLAGAARHARAFISGVSPARVNWCVAMVPSPRGEDEGLLVLTGVGVPDSDDTVSCDKSLQHPVLRPLVTTLTVE